MLTVLAWKNIWRNKKRSLIIIVATTLGLWGTLLASALMVGWGESMVNTAIDRDLGHIQLHRPGFAKDREIGHFIPDGQTVLRRIRETAGVRAASGRTLADGMAASPTSTFGVRIAGVDPQQAAKVTNIHTLLVAGGYFDGQGKNPIVIGRKLAERLGLKLHSKLVLGFPAMDGTLVYGAFRVVGIYKSESAQFDKTRVFVRQGDLLRLLGSPPIIHEIAVRLQSSRSLAALLATLRADFPALAVESWRTLSPEVAVTSAAMQSWSYIFVGIILMALVFGITNTMLMAVMERVQELGILLAVGMRKSKIFRMILLETFMLSLTGGIGGMLCGKLTIAALGRTGIDFSAFAASLASFGAGTRIYPTLPASMYFALAAMIMAAAAVAASVPAFKAIHLQPAEAIRM